jgi:fumarate reductase flavoprotein subunit
MMGGVAFDLECRTSMPRLFAAGEDTGGVHGANRLGGNGVANSTVFGGIAGASMARAVLREGGHADPASGTIERSLDRAFSPLGRPSGDLNEVREGLMETMWNDVGILRSGDGLSRGAAALDGLQDAVARCGVADGDRRYNLTWTDRLNLENLIQVSRTICAAAQARTDSRGAHFREDHPATSDLATSRYTVVRMRDDDIAVTTEPVRFTRIEPGQTLLDETPEASLPVLAAHS